MSLLRKFQLLLRAEFISAFGLAMHYFFKPKPTINYPFERNPQSPRFRVNMHCAAIQTGRNAASRANCAKPYVRRRQSRSKLGPGEMTGPGARCATTSIW
jgi:hypothetical protein